MRIIASDGKEGFMTMEECIAYEKELIQREREKKEKDEALKVARYKDIEKCYEKLFEKINAYEIDYNIKIYTDNEVLNAEIDAAIKGAVKAKTREFFYQTMEKHVNETADKCLKRWTDRGWGSTTTIERMIRERVDSTIRSEISNISVSSSDITARIDKKLDRIGEIIEAEISRRIDGIGLEDYIAKIVADEVQKVLPGKVLELLVKGVKN